MRKDFGPQSWLLPMPVLVVGTYDADGTPNAMTAAWGGMYDTNQVMLCLAQDHLTTENIRARQDFTVSFATVKTVAAADFVGTESGRDLPDKVTVAGLHAETSEHIYAPLFAEMPMALECRLNHFTEDGIVVGDVLHAVADESVLTGNGDVDLEKLAPVSFDPVNNVYRTACGRVVGQAFAVGASVTEAHHEPDAD